MYVTINISRGYTASGTGSSGGYNFVVNICSNSPSQCQGKGYMGVQVSKTDSSCYSTAKQWSSSNYNSIATSLIDPSNPESGIRLIYNNDPDTTGYTRKTEVHIKCDKSASYGEQFTFHEELPAGGSGSTYVFEMVSKCACPNVCKGGGQSTRKCALGCGYGIGGLFITLSVIGIVAFFGIGTIVCKFVLKKEGREIIPFGSFVLDIPFLLKDGVMLFVDLFSQITKKGQYQQV
jgi:hypothetical protein